MNERIWKGLQHAYWTHFPSSHAYWLLINLEHVKVILHTRGSENRLVL